MKGLTQEELIRQLEVLYDHLVGVAEDYIALFTPTFGQGTVPKISDSKIKFRQFNDGLADEDVIQDIPSILHTRVATPVDIAIWRAAELRSEGKPAKVVIEIIDGGYEHETIYGVHIETEGDLGTRYEDPTDLFTKE